MRAKTSPFFDDFYHLVWGDALDMLHLFSVPVLLTFLIMRDWVMLFRVELYGVLEVDRGGSGSLSFFQLRGIRQVDRYWLHCSTTFKYYIERGRGPWDVMLRSFSLFYFVEGQYMQSSGP